MVGSCHENGRVLDVVSWFDVMKRRYGVQGLEFLFAVFGASVVRAPGVPNGELVKAKHVHHSNLGDGSSEQIWTLVDAGADEETAVASSIDGNLGRAGVPLLDEVLGCRLEVVEASLLVQFSWFPVVVASCLMPVLPVLSASSNVCNAKKGVEMIDEDGAEGVEGRSDADAEPSVAIKERAGVPRMLLALLPDYEHGDLGSILAFIEDLFGLKIFRTMIGNDVLAQLVRLHRLQVKPEFHSRVHKPDETVEELHVLSLSTQRADGTDVRKLNLLNKRAICKLEETEGLLGVIHVANHEILLSNAQHVVEHFLLVFKDVCPLLLLCILDVDADDFVARRILVCSEVEFAFSVGDIVVSSIKVVNQPHELGVVPSSRQDLIHLADVHSVHRRSAFRDGDDEVFAIIRHGRSWEPLGILRGLEDQNVFGLFGPELVEVDGHLNVAVCLAPSLQVVAFDVVLDRLQALWLRVSRIEEAGVILDPRDSRELHPFDLVLSVLLRGDLPHEDRLPVGATGGNSMRPVPSGVRECIGADALGAVRGEQVGIEELLSRRVETRLHHQHVLVLQPIILVVVVAEVFPLASLEGTSCLCIVVLLG
mmetsp:Transcript_13475/g.46896  ORF Transcript_13475/g.46896 Transcript_13475/m.46896 type:complete len:594 (+) Transcript_13475:307-2088(+)